MDYKQIIDASLKYADREDDATAGMISTFIEVVESKINRAIDTRHIYYRAIIAMQPDQTYFGLPSGFKKLRDIQVQTSAGLLIGTPKYVAPETMNAAIVGGSSELLYTIIANQIQIHPAQVDKQIEVIYSRRLEPMTLAGPVNWLTAIAPDIYIFGIVCEIAAYTKDPEAAAMWQERFYAAIATLQAEDDSSRWSGPALQMRME